MTPAERVRALAHVGWTRQEFARRLRVHHSIVARWLKDADPPVWVDRWLNAAARWMVRHMDHTEPVPPPVRGRPRKPPATGAEP